MDELKFTGRMSTLELARHINLAEEMDEEDRKILGLHARNNLDQADASRARWKEWYARALKLAMQVAEAKTYPWTNASNVKFPLLTVAAMGYHARAYPTIVNGGNLVKAVVIGEDDPHGQRKARADRVGRHMSYQMLEMTDWEQVTDQSLLAQAILGTTFKKFWFDSVRRRRMVSLVYAENLVLDYFTRSLDTSRCMTELYDLTGNDIYERIARGTFLDATVDMESLPPPHQMPVDPIRAARDQRQKIMQNPQTMEDDDLYPFAEQYCYYDFDGDGYKEPYVLQFRRDTGTLYRVVSRFYEDDIEYVGSGKNRKVLTIRGDMPYVKKGFIPSPDGGFYDLGFGALLGPINESVDTSINQMFDSGHLRVMGGGFLGRGVRVKGGEINIRMNGWIRVDSTGDDLKKNILPHQMPDVSETLFKLMTFLIEYAQRIASANDVQMGENPGQNTPAETTRTMNENGRLIFNALFKREWKSMGEEARMFYELNRRHPIFLSEEDREVADFFKIEQKDYQGTSAGIYPACDPTVTTSAEKRQQAELLKSNMMIPGHDVEEIMRRIYDTFNVPDVQRVFPGAEAMKGKPGQLPPNAQVLAAQAKLSDSETKRMKEAHQAMIARGKLLDSKNQLRMKVAQMLDEHALNEAKIAETGARIALLRAQAKSEADNTTLAKTELDLRAIEMHNESLFESARLLNEILQGMKDDGTDAGGSAGDQSGEGQMAPVAPQQGNQGAPQLPGPQAGGGAGGMGA